MAESIKVPSLSKDGWVDTPESMGERLFAYFLSSNFSQDPIYGDSVTSYMKIVQRSGNNKAEFLRDIESSLFNLFTAHFQSVVTEAKYLTDTAIEDSEVTVYVNYTDSQGKPHNLGKILQSQTNLINILYEASNVN